MIDRSFLICSIYTLLPEDKIFQSLEYRYGLDLTLVNNGYLYNKLIYSNSFYSVINKINMRKFAYNLVEPILVENYLISALITKNEKLTYQTTNFKRYLKKFRYNYYMYFCRYGKNLITDKEINSFAVESLFLLTGI